MAHRARKVLIGALAIALAVPGCLGPGEGVTSVPEGPGEDVAPAVDRAPTAVIQGPTAALVGEKVVFDASGSSDPENGTLRYTWDMGDGTFAEGPQAAHAFTVVGRHEVGLNVTDGSGLSDLATLIIEVEQPVPAEPVVFEAWSASGSLAVANPFMERMGRPLPFSDEPWPVYGGDRLADFQARSLGQGIDHELYAVAVPTNGTRLYFVLDWDPVATPPLVETVVDLDLLVFDMDGRLLPDGFSAATGNAPERFIVTDDAHLQRGTYHVLVLLYRGAEVGFTVRATLTASGGGTVSTV